jgi:hypothetical protein
MFLNRLSFPGKEIRTLLLVTLLIGLAIGFNDGRATVGIDEYWIRNFCLCCLAVFFALVIRVFIQKIVGFKLGFETEFKSNPYGLFAGIFTAFLFDGHAYLFVPGGTRLKEKPEMHLGSYPYLKVRLKYSLVSIAGWGATLALLIISKGLSGLLPNNIFLAKMALVNALFLVYFLIPLPPESDAFYLAFWSRTWFIFLLAISIGISFSIFLLPAVFSLFLSLAIGLTAAYFFYTKLEK